MRNLCAKKSETHSPFVHVVVFTSADPTYPHRLATAFISILLSHRHPISLHLPLYDTLRRACAELREKLSESEA